MINKPDNPLREQLQTLDTRWNELSRQIQALLAEQQALLEPLASLRRQLQHENSNALPVSNSPSTHNITFWCYDCHLFRTAPVPPHVTGALIPITCPSCGRIQLKRRFDDAE